MAAVRTVLGLLHGAEVSSERFADRALERVVIGAELFDLYVVDIMVAVSDPVGPFDREATRGGLAAGLALADQLIHASIAVNQIVLVSASASADLLKPAAELCAAHDGLRLVRKTGFDSAEAFANAIVGGAPT